MNNELDLKQLYRDMELELISSMKRNLSKHLKEETRVGFDFTQWQAETLKEIKRFERENKDIINNYTGSLNKDVSKQLKDELKQGSLNELKRYKHIMGDKYKESMNLNHSFFHLNDRKIKGLIKEIQGSNRTANTACFRMMNDQYRKVIAKAVMFSNHSVVSPTKAIDMATKEFLTAGINCIEYKGGRRVNIADYCDMAVRTANTRAQLIGEGQFRQEIGEHLVKPTQHNTSCEKCARWEGKTLIDDVYSGGTKKDGNYPLLSEAIAQGFFHPRCRHGLPTYYEELDELEFDEHGLTDKSMRQYQENLNWINNNIQKYIRLEAGSLDKENIRKYSQKKIQWINRKPINFISNPNLFDNKIIEYESKIVGEKMENAYIIDSIGRVYRFKGTEYNVEIPSWLDLKDAIVTHNHPKSTTNYSFSADDIMLFLKRKLKRLHGVDDRYVYYLEKTSDTKYVDIESIRAKFKKHHIEALGLSMQGKLDIDYDEYDYIVKMLAKEYNFTYKRVKK